MTSVLTVLIILGCAAYLYLKGTFVRAFATVIITICASVVAFGYFELLANVFISRIILVTWAQPLCFLLLFILAFAILQTIAVQLTHQPVDLGTLAERIGRVVCGLLSGLIISGLLLTVLAIAPLSNSTPYQRFDAYKPDTEKPNKALFNADGFATGWFSIISRGSFSGKRSFAALHPNVLESFGSRPNGFFLWYFYSFSACDDSYVVSNAVSIQEELVEEVGVEGSKAFFAAEAAAAYDAEPSCRKAVGVE